MKKIILLSSLVCSQAFAKDIFIKAPIPAGQKVVQVTAKMYSTTESSKCATFTIGTKIKTLPAKILSAGERDFTAKLSGQAVEKLKNSYCAYQGPEINVLLENPNKEQTLLTVYEDDNGSWVVARTEEI